MINFEIKNQNGRSMIEMLGVLAIIGVLSVGGIAGYSKAMMKYRINKTIEQITLIAGNVRAFFAPQGNYDGLNSTDTGKAIIKKAKLVPDEMLTLDSDGKISKIEHIFGGLLFLNQENEKNFDLYFESPIPLEACIELISYDWTESNIGAINVGQSSWGKFLSTPIDIDKAIDVCSTAENKNGQGSFDIIFYFDIDVNAEPWKTRLK